MKKSLLFVAGLFFCCNLTAQQTKFGYTAGYSNLTFKSSYDNTSASSGSGFYIGAVVDIPLSEAFHIQSGVNYANIEAVNMLFIPVMAKYYIKNSNFNLQAGPQASINLEGINGFTNLLGLDLAFGAGYDINEHFYLEARYAFELTNRLKGEFDGAPEPPKAHFNTFTTGIGYKF